MSASISAIENLHNRINLVNIPFTDRGSRLMLFRQGDELAIRLAERWAKWEAEVGHYRQRPPVIQRFAFLNEDGIPLHFDTDTYPHVARLSTSERYVEWTFVDAETFLVALSPGRHSFQFEVLAERGQPDRRGGTLYGKRNIAYSTNAEILHNEVIPVQKDWFRVKITLEAESDHALLLNVTPRLGYNRSIPTPEAAIEDARMRWEEWFKATPPVLEIYRKQYDYAWWIMRAGLLNTRYYFTREAMVPSKIHYIGVWQWDQFFHALAYRHVDSRLAEDQLRIVLDHQRSDGMLPDAVHDEGLVTHLLKPVEADVTKPPLIAWTALKLYERSGHLDFLEEIYEGLARWQNWWINNNLNDCGLCEYRHPFSSGLDDSPLWDSGMPVVAPDLNTYLYIQWESLARIAELIGLRNEAKQHRANAKDWGKRIVSVLWNQEKGLFDSLHNGVPVEALTPFSLLPLWTGLLSADKVQRLVHHLSDPETFWPKWPLPTVALNDPKFDAQMMWRGPTWANINYLFVEALQRTGQEDLAGALRRKTLEMIMGHSDIYEYYNPLTGNHPPKAAPIFGWSSAVFIDLAIQETEKLHGTGR